MRITPFLLIPILGFLTIQSNAQAYTLDSIKLAGPYVSSYKKAIGVKMYPSAISYKSFLTDNKAL